MFLNFLVLEEMIHHKTSMLKVAMKQTVRNFEMGYQVRYLNKSSKKYEKNKNDYSNMILLA